MSMYGAGFVVKFKETHFYAFLSFAGGFNPGVGILKKAIRD